MSEHPGSGTEQARRPRAHETGTATDEQSLAAVRDSEALVDLLAARIELRELEHADPLAAALGGWVRTIDLEVATSGLPVATAATGLGAGQDVVVAPATATVFPVARRGEARPRRAPWWLLSASAAAVIAVLGVGVGLQDVQQVGPATSVEESVQSIEATLTASRRAAEAGDVAGARVLLEQARAMVAGLPAEERGRWEVAVRAAEVGLRTAEERVREGGAPDDVDRPGGPTSLPTDPGRPDEGSTSTPGTTPATAGTPTATSSTTTSTAPDSPTPSSTSSTTAPGPDPGRDPDDSPRQDDERRPTTTPSGPPGGQGRGRPDGAGAAPAP